jgi:hypothetical protein
LSWAQAPTERLQRGFQSVPAQEIRRGSVIEQDVFVVGMFSRQDAVIAWTSGGTRFSDKL